MRASTERLIEELDERVHAVGGDWSVKVDTGSEAAWAAEVRITRFPNLRGQPDRSSAFFQAGGDVAEGALEPALRAALAEVASWDLSEKSPPRWTDAID